MSGNLINLFKARLCNDLQALAAFKVLKLLTELNYKFFAQLLFST